MTNEQERAEFEAWALARWPSAVLSPYQNNCGITILERYKHPKLQAAWEAYQAGRAAMQSQDRKDAERYRWLKEQFRIMSPDMGGNHTWVLQRPLRKGYSIDAVCDASREQNKGTNFK